MKKRPKAAVTQPAAAGDAPPGPRLSFPVVGVGASAGGLETHAQLQAKLLELEGTTNELASLLGSTNIAVIFLDRQLHIRRYTPAVRDLLELTPQDVGRPLHNLAFKCTDENLEPDMKRVLETSETLRREVTSFSGRVYVRSVLPYHTPRIQVEGVVITYIDITDRQRAEMALRDSVEQHRLMLESLRDYAIFLLDADGIIKTWPKAAERVFGYTREEAVGQPLSLIFPPEPGGEGLARQELQVAKVAGSVSQEGWRLRKDGTRFWSTGVLSAVNDEQGHLRGFVKVLSDARSRTTCGRRS